MAEQCSVYLFEVLTYRASNPLKVGVSIDPKRRLREVRAETQSPCQMVRQWKLPSRLHAACVEKGVLASFPRFERYSGFCTIREMVEGDHRQIIKRAERLIAVVIS